MLLPERHHYDLYLRSLGGEAIVFDGKSRVYAGLLALSAAVLIGVYVAVIRQMPFAGFGAAAHVFFILSAFAIGAGAAALMLRRERLVLKRRDKSATYELTIGGKAYRWEAPLGAFSAVSAEIIAQSDGKAVGPRYWVFHLDRWDGARVRFSPSRFLALPAAEADQATRLTRALAAFLDCEARIADETRLSICGQSADGHGGARTALPSS